jgi:hypothetical protein
VALAVTVVQVAQGLLVAMAAMADPFLAMAAPVALVVRAE